MRTLKVKLSARESKYYPVEARFTLNGVKYSLVFCTEEEARHYCEDRFYPRPVTFLPMLYGIASQLDGAMHSVEYYYDLRVTGEPREN